MMKTFARRLMTITLTLCLLCGMMPLSAAAVDIAAPADGNFTLMWVSDPQIYTRDYRDILSMQNDWIIQNANRLNVKYAFHTGDLVHNYTNESQWEFVSSEYQKWDKVGFAYGVLAGNHDMSGTDYSRYSQYFGKSRYENNWWYGGDYKDNYGHYDLYTTGGVDFVFVYLSYGDHTAQDYAWVNSVLAEHSDRIAVLSVHDYLATSGGRSERGDILFEEVVLKNPNIRMVLCGHNYNADRVVDEIDDNGDGDADRTVYQLMANYQYTSNGGNGFIRFMECDRANGTITHRTYSPYTASFGSDYETGVILDEYGMRDEFVTPFDFSDPVPKAADDPASGTVVYSSEMSFAPTAENGAVTLPVVYRNTAESGAVYRGVGVYDRFFSLDAADAVADPTSVNYVVTEYKASTGHTIKSVIRGTALSNAAVRVPIPQNGAVVVLPASAPVSLDTLTVGRRVMLNKLHDITTPAALYTTHLTVPSWGARYNLSGINRMTGDAEWVLHDALSAGVDSHVADMLFAFAPVSGTTYRLTASNTALGVEKTLAVPDGGFVLAVNGYNASPRLLTAVREHFTSGLQVNLNGHVPGNEVQYQTTDLLAPSVNDWKKDSTIVVEQNDDAQVLYNTDGLYPKATYYYPTPLVVDPSATVLHYDYMLESAVCTSIILFFEGSDSSITIQQYFYGADISDKSGDLNGNDIRREGKIDLSAMNIPAACYREDGTLRLSGIRIFMSGTANKSLYLYTLALTTDRTPVGVEVTPRTTPLLNADITVTDPTKHGGYTYDGGKLLVTSEDADGYTLTIDINRTVHVVDLNNWLMDVSATTAFDIQLLSTTSRKDRYFGLVSDFWPQLCGSCDNGFIPAGSYVASLDYHHCFGWNGILPANGKIVVKQVKIILRGVGTLAIDTLQLSSTDTVAHLYDASYASLTTPVYFMTSDLYTIGDTYIENIAADTTVAALQSGIAASGTLTVYQNGVALAEDALAATGMTLVASDSTTVWTLLVDGDIDADGRATTADARALLLSILGAANLDTAQTAVADTDRSGIVNTRDARLLLLALAEM